MSSIFVSHKSGGCTKYSLESTQRNGKPSWTWRGSCAVCAKEFSFTVSTPPEQVTPHRVCVPCQRSPRGAAEALFH